ncbi:MAG: M64 family metallopeptidase [Phycisphaerales bacterium JB039]
MPMRCPCLLLAAMLGGAGAAAPAPGQEVGAAPDLGPIYWDTVGPDGRLTGGRIEARRTAPDPEARIDAPVEVLWDPGAVDAGGGALERIDLVIVGDGYQAPELARYRSDAAAMVNYLFTQEPFATYRNFFRIYRVDVVSADSGVDHDPSRGVLRDTALNMGFWCYGIDRLLCVDVALARAYAASAPHGFDQIVAIANSRTYGGAGYALDDLATVAGGSAVARDIVVHEFGHSFARLDDEYDYGDGAAYTFAEPYAINASVLTAGEMRAGARKWHQWLGFSGLPWDGPVGTYEGCSYYQYGIYRPSPDSKMRSLHRPFNAPSAERLIIEFYRLVNPIDDATPEGTLRGDEMVFVDPVDPVGRPLEIQWYLDDEPIAGATGETLDLAALALGAGTHTLGVVVADNTPWVRHKTFHQALMTEQRQWEVEIACGADCDGSGALEFFDFLCFQSAFAAGGASADCDGDGALTLFDFLCFQNAFAAGCP